MRMTGVEEIISSTPVMSAPTLSASHPAQSRSLRRMILPVAVFGISSRIPIDRGRL